MQADPKKAHDLAAPPSAPHESVPAHVGSAWRSWLSALATDPEAAMAAALTYESLPPQSREAWLDSLALDGTTLDVPSVALYAPLLAVESDVGLRQRIEAAIARDYEAHDAQDATDATDARTSNRSHPPRAWRGVAPDGVHVCAIVSPLYLDFVEVLRCRYTPGGGFVRAEHDPLAHLASLPPVGEVDGVAVEPTPLRIVVEELAHAVLADKRASRESPRVVALFAHLFGPDLEL